MKSSQSTRSETILPVHHVATEIRILSAFLGHEHINWRPADSPNDCGLTIDPEAESSKPYFHIANLLNLQKETVVAVTGTIGRDTAPKIVISSNSTQKSESSVNLYEWKNILQAPAMRGIDLKSILVLHSKAQEHISIEQYISDLFTLLAARRNNVCSSQTILKWVIFHCWSKLHKRFRRLRLFKEGHLFDLLEKWKLSDKDKGLGEDSDKNFPKITAETSISMSKTLISACERHHLTLHDIKTSPKFVLNIESAEELIHGVASAFKEIEALDIRVFKIEETKPTQKKKAKPPGLERLVDDSKPQDGQTYAHLDLVVEDFFLLSTILEDKNVHALFFDTSLQSRLIPKELQRGLKVKTGSTTQDPNEDDGVGPLTESDFDGNFALRYMRMLVSPATALRYVSKERVLTKLATAEITLIYLFEHRPTAGPTSTGLPSLARDAVYHSVLAGLENYLQCTPGLSDEMKKEAKDWLKEHWDKAKVASESACHVHAEAGVMALACEVHRSPSSKHSPQDDSNLGYLTVFEGVSTVPIGINMKCCSLCFRLGQLLNASTSEVDLTFQLPDTHEVIYAWDPPVFGIPDSVLETLRTELHDKVVHIAAMQGKQFVSRTRQSSPTSGSQSSDSPTAPRQERHKPQDILDEQDHIEMDFHF